MQATSPRGLDLEREMGGGETPQGSKLYNEVFLAAQRDWAKLATAKSTYRFLDKAQNLGIKTNDVHHFLVNQQNLRKVKTNDRHNANLCKKNINNLL